MAGLQPYRAPLAPSSLARAFGSSTKATEYDPLKVITNVVPKSIEKNAPMGIALISSLELDASELGKIILERTKLKASTWLLVLGVGAAFAPLPRWAIQMGLDTALGAALAKVIQKRSASSASSAS